jgi:hypothetical protein
MKQLNGIVNLLKIMLKYGVYFTALFKVVDFAIVTFEAIDPPKPVENE